MSNSNGDKTPQAAAASNGFARYCPICDQPARSFLTYGVASRQDARCPSCSSVERHRLFWLYLERKTSFFSSPPRSALHVAPEAILEQKFRSLIGQGYLTADLSGNNVDVQMDISSIPYPDAAFDFIYCSHVLEHVLDDRQAMREFHRVLSPTGIAILLVPITSAFTIEDPSITDPQERLKRFGQKDHVRRYGPDYVQRLEEAGFTVEQYHREDFLSAEEMEHMGITRVAGTLHICHKKSGA